MAIRVDDLIREAKENAKKKVWLFNPDTKDFKVKLGSKVHILHAQETKKFPYLVAQHLKKHLITYLNNKRGGKYLDPKRKEKIEKEIEVKI